MKNQQLFLDGSEGKSKIIQLILETIEEYSTLPEGKRKKILNLY